MSYILIHQPTKHSVAADLSEIEILLKILPSALRTDWKIRDGSGTRPLSEATLAELSAQSDNTLEIETANINTDKRGHARFRKEFHFSAFSGANVFQSETVDVSMQGIQLREPLPANFPKQFRASLTSDRFEVALVVERTSDSTATKFRIIDINNKDVLRKMLLI